MQYSFCRLYEVLLHVAMSWKSRQNYTEYYAVRKKAQITDETLQIHTPIRKTGHFTDGISKPYKRMEPSQIIIRSKGFWLALPAFGFLIDNLWLQSEWNPIEALQELKDETLELVM